MEFSQFRDTGELSDLTVSVDGKDFKLHKFPLFIKSDFFRALARSQSGNLQEKIDLDNFPGGSKTFEDVANYCYNVRIELTRENICQIRCAAEFLQMGSRGNLADTADRYLTDILTSAKLARDFDSIADLILFCKDLGGISEQAKVVDKCIMAVIDCWLLSSKYTRHSVGMESWTAGARTREKLFQMPLAWFVELFTHARDKSVRPAVLADLVQSYIDYVIDGKVTEDSPEVEMLSNLKQEVEEKHDQGEETGDVTANSDEGAEQGEQTGEQTDDAKAEETKSQSDSEGKEQAEQEAEEHVEQKEEQKSTEQAEPSTEAADDKVQDVETEPPETAEVDQSLDGKSDQSEQDTPETKETGVDDIPTDVQIAVALDSIIPEIPENILLAEYLSPHWALRVLKIAEANECKCTDQVRKLVSRVVYRLSPEDLVQMSDDMLTEIVRESCKDTENRNQQMACALVDTYLSELSARDKLTVDTFNKMVDVVPNEYRFSYDTLFQVLESLLKSEKVKLTDEQKQSLLESIDYSRLSEGALQRAYETELVPQSYVTKAALELCAKLRSELEEAKHIIITQERELEKYSPVKYSGYYSKEKQETRAAQVPPVSRRRDPLRASAYMTSQYVSPTPYSSPGVPTLASDAELQMVLDSLDKTSERDYPLRSSDSYNFRSSLPYTPLFDEKDCGIEGSDVYSQPLPPYRSLYYRPYKY